MVRAVETLQTKIKLTFLDCVECCHGYAMKQFPNHLLSRFVRTKQHDQLQEQEMQPSVLGRDAYHCYYCCYCSYY